MHDKHVCRAWRCRAFGDYHELELQSVTVPKAGSGELCISVSAFAPIANPSASDWGIKQLRAYLGDAPDVWSQHDSTALLQSAGWSRDILIDQGGSDQFLDLLRPEALADAMARTRTAGAFRTQAGYDHSYYFVSTFMRDHVAWHAERL